MKIKVIRGKNGFAERSKMNYQNDYVELSNQLLEYQNLL